MQNSLSIDSMGQLVGAGVTRYPRSSARVLLGAVYHFKKTNNKYESHGKVLDSFAIEKTGIAPHFLIEETGKVYQSVSYLHLIKTSSLLICAESIKDHDFTNYHNHTEAQKSALNSLISAIELAFPENKNEDIFLFSYRLT